MSPCSAHPISVSGTWPCTSAACRHEGVLRDVLGFQVEWEPTGERLPDVWSRQPGVARGGRRAGTRSGGQGALDHLGLIVASAELSTSGRRFSSRGRRSRRAAEDAPRRPRAPATSAIRTITASRSSTTRPSAASVAYACHSRRSRSRQWMDCAPVLSLPARRGSSPRLPDIQLVHVLFHHAPRRVHGHDGYGWLLSPCGARRARCRGSPDRRTSGPRFSSSSV